MIERVTDLIESALRSGQAVPPYWAAQLVEAVHLASEEDAQVIAEAMMDVQPSVLDQLLTAPVTGRSTALLDALLERAGNPSRSRSDRARDLRAALPHLLASGAVERAGEVLGRLEDLATDGTGIVEFLEILESDDRYDPAWSREDARWSRIRLLGQEGRAAEAVPILEAEFYHQLRREEYHARENAEDILDTMREFGADRERLAPPPCFAGGKWRGRDVPLEGEDESTGPPVRILFIGGDERQVENAKSLKEELEAADAKLRIDFVHPGWSSNWGPLLERLSGKLPRYDGVVIMRFIRTEFGRQLRKSLEVPWVLCGGAGRGSMERSIRQAVRWARSARTQMT